MGIQEAAGLSDDATLKVGMAETEEAEQTQLSQLELGLKCARLAKEVAERTKVTAAGHFFALYANLLSKDAWFQ